MGRLRVRGGASPEFLRLSINLNQAHFKRRGQGTSQRHVYKRDFDSLLLPLPHPAEQSVIAEALSDVDSLIESLDLLIAKKRDIKQGATQQLLSGNTRLPGFSSDWTIKTMRSLGSTYGGLSGKTADDFGAGSALFIPFTNVMKNVAVDLAQLEPVSIKFGENQNQVFAGDVLFNGSSETPEEVGLATVVPVGTQTLYLNSFCFGFRLNLDVPTSGLYLAYFFRSQLGRAIVYSLAQGSTRYNISKVALLNQSLRLPSLREQLDIAAVLTDMDTEIETLAARREKTIQVKEGMMSELLTGRTRLL
jgi:type I restriction enzyme S subunit